MPAGSVLGTQARPGHGFRLIVGHSRHEYAGLSRGVVQHDVVDLLPVEGQIDGFPDPRIGKGFLLYVYHQAHVERRDQEVGHDLAVGILYQLGVLLGRKRRAAGIGHVDLTHLEGRDEAGGVGDDEVVYAAEEGTSLLEVVGVLGHLVEVAALVLVQHEGSRTGIVLDDVLRLVQVYVLLQKVLGEDLGVVDGQEFDECPRGELQIEFDRIGVKRLQFAFTHRLDVVAGEPGTADGNFGVVVAGQGENDVIGGQVRAIVPFYVLIKMERESGPAVGDVPTGAQVADHLAGVHRVVLHHLVIELGVGNDAGK